MITRIRILNPTSRAPEFRDVTLEGLPAAHWARHYQRHTGRKPVEGLMDDENGITIKTVEASDD